MMASGQQSSNTQAFSMIPADTRGVDTQKRKITGVKIPIQKQILMQQQNREENDLFLTYLHQEGKDYAKFMGSGNIGPMATGMTGVS